MERGTVSTRLLAARLGVERSGSLGASSRKRQAGEILPVRSRDFVGAHAAAVPVAEGAIRPSVTGRIASGWAE
jgi:hypothetical protein